MDYVNERALRAEAVVVAQAVLLGDLDVIRGAWHLEGLRRGWEAEDDPDFALMWAVVTETDHLPLGPVREEWSEAALAEKDKELEAAAEKWGDEVRVSCRRIIDRYGPASWSS